MIKLMLLAIVLTSSGGTQAQAPSRSDLKKPLSEAVEKVLRLLGVCQHCGRERANGAGQFAIVSEPDVTIVSQRRVKP